LSWGASAGALSYEYCLDTINNNSCDTSWTITPMLSATPSGLAPNTTYWWQVRARNTAGTTDANGGTWWNFTTASARINVAAAAQGGVATASSFYNANYAPGGANDGDRAGVNWGAGGGWNDATLNVFGDWLEVDFAAQQTINEIDVFTVQDNYAAPIQPTLAQTFTLYGITDFQVQYWDGSSRQWLTVPGGTVSGNTNVWRQFSFAPLVTTGIRVLVNNALNGYARITEVEAYTAP
jgi:hypothetical protein